MTPKGLFKFTILLLVVFLLAELSLAQRPELVLQTGHSLYVRSVAFSPDGKIVASGSGDETIKLWDVASGAELRVLTAHSSEVSSVVFSPDGKLLASGGSWDHTIRLWDVTTGAELCVFTTGDSNVVQSVAFSPDGKTLASGGSDNTIRLWDVASGSQLRVLTGHSDDVLSVAFSPDGKTLASGGSDNTIRLWDVASGTQLRALTGHSDEVYSVAFSPDGKRLASGSWDQTLRLWDTKSGALLRVFAGNSDAVRSVAFSPDGKTLASGGWDIRLWDVASGAQLLVLKGHSAVINSVAFSPDRSTLVSGSADNTIGLWDVASGAQLRSLTGHSSEVESVAFSIDGRTLAIESRTLAPGRFDNTVRLWDLANGAPPRRLTISPDVDLVWLSPDVRTMAARNKETIQLRDVTSGALLHDLKFSSYGVNFVVFSPDGKTLATVSGDKKIRLWDVKSGAELHVLRGHTSYIGDLVFSPDGKMLAANGGGENIRLWDVKTGAQLRVLMSSYEVSQSLAFSPDGRTLASGGGFDNTIRLWDVSSGAELRALTGHSNLVTTMAFSPDGKTLASGSWDQTIRLWDVSSGQGLRTLSGHFNYVSSVAFSPNGKMLASGSKDNTSRLWDVASGADVANLVGLDENDWVAFTSEGQFDGSPDAWKKLLWRFNHNTFEHAPVEAFFKEFYYPNLLPEIIAHQRPIAPAKDLSQVDIRQPIVSIHRINQETVIERAQEGPSVLANTVSTRSLEVELQVTDNISGTSRFTHPPKSGANDLRLFRNGSLVKLWPGDVFDTKESQCEQVATKSNEPRRAFCKATVPIVEGENKFTAYAFNHDNIKSSDAELIVTGADSLKRQGTAYVFAIGVNDYSNPNYKLSYAVADAEDFAAEVKRQQESLKRYAKVEVIALANEQATKANITQKLSDLAKQAQPEDAVIVFFAGHGTAHGNEFYLIPHDLGYDGPRDNLSEAGLQKILAHSVSDRELERLFEPIDAGQLLFVIDACNSGQALEAEEKRRGPMNSKGLAQLAYEKGMYVLTAAQSYQAAQEAAKFGHGFLTYALVEEGLKQGAADREPKNGSIDIREWLNFATDEVPKLQESNSLEALRGRGRYLVFVGDGTATRDDGTSASKTADEKARDNIQRPRVFYRRELEANPLVIAIPK